MAEPYDKLRKTVKLTPMAAKEPTERQQQLAKQAAQAQARFELVRKRKAGKRTPKKLINDPGYVGKHRKDGK